MKTFIYSALVMSLFIGFSACNKDQTKNASTNSRVKSLQLLSEYLTSGSVYRDTFSYTYDTDGRIIAETSRNLHSSFVYGSSLVSVNGTHYPMNISGTISGSLIQTIHQDAFGSNPAIDHNYVYDTDGHLKEEVYTQGSIGDTDTVRYTWSGGNLVSAIYASSPASPAYTYTYTNYAERRELSFSNMDLGSFYFIPGKVFGKSTANLISSYTRSSNNRTMNYFYTFDNSGRVATMVQTDPDYKYTYTYIYE